MTMYNLKFSLYRFTYWKPNDNNPYYHFIISNDWNTAIELFYNTFFNQQVTITNIELCANENIDMSIDDSYILSKHDINPITLNSKLN